MLQLPVELQNLIQNAPVPVTVADPAVADMPLVAVNDAFLDLTGYTEDEVLGRNCRFLQGPGTDPVVRQSIRLSLARDQRVACTVLNYTKTGGPFDNFLVVRSLNDRQGLPICVVGCQLVSNQKVDEDQLLQRLTSRGPVQRKLRIAIERTRSTIHDSHLLNAETLFACAAQCLRRAEMRSRLTMSA